MPRRSRPQPAARTEPRIYSRTLSLRLTEAQYRRLRDFVTAEEKRTGQRVTHQAVIEMALTEWLDRKGG